MAISTYKTFLMKSEDGSAYTKLIDIKDFPDVGGDPELLDTTTLSDKMRTYIMGVEDVGNGGLAFTANYTHEEYTTLAALVGVQKYYAVWFGGTESGGVATPTGSDGKFSFEGQLAVKVNGGAVNEVVNMTVTIIPNTVITAE